MLHVTAQLIQQAQTALSFEHWVVIVGGAGFSLMWWEIRSLRTTVHQLQGAVAVWTQVLDMINRRQRENTDNAVSRSHR